MNHQQGNFVTLLFLVLVTKSNCNLTFTNKSANTKRLITFLFWLVERKQRNSSLKYL